MPQELDFDANERQIALMDNREITIDFADEARLGDGEYRVFYGMQRGKRVRILIHVDDWDLFLRANDQSDEGALVDLARIAASSDPFRTEVDGVDEYKVRYRK